MNINATFLNGVLEVEIYMDQLEDLIQKGKKHLVCKFKKVLYMLNQSLMMWYHYIVFFFINEGFCKSQADHSLYFKQTGKYLLVTILYVDDVIILAKNIIQLKWLKLELKIIFEISNLIELHYCLGVEFKRNRKARIITMNQMSYAEGVFKYFNI